MSRDHIDALIDEWAVIRRELVGNKLPLRGSDYLGAPRCTLGAIRDLHAGAHSYGAFEQHWPPFPYERSVNATVINFLFQEMNPTLKEIMDFHWVRTTPKDKRLRAAIMGISRTKYWERVDRVKCTIQGGLTMLSVSGQFSPQAATVFKVLASSNLMKDML